MIFRQHSRTVRNYALTNLEAEASESTHTLLSNSYNFIHAIISPLVITIIFIGDIYIILLY